jgi:hypothetical protein
MDFPQPPHALPAKTRETAGSGVHLHRFHSSFCPGFALSDGQDSGQPVRVDIPGQAHSIRSYQGEVFRHQELLAQRGFIYKPYQLQYKDQELDVWRILKEKSLW